MSLSGVKSTSLSSISCMLPFVKYSVDAFKILDDALFAIVICLARFGGSFSFEIKLFPCFCGNLFSCWSCPLSYFFCPLN